MASVMMLAVPDDRPLVIDDRGAPTSMRASEAATGRSLFDALAGRSHGRADPHMDAIERHLWAAIAIQEPARVQQRFDTSSADEVLLLQVDACLSHLPGSVARDEAQAHVRAGRTLMAIETLAEAETVQWAHAHGQEMPGADDLVALVGAHLGRPLPDVQIRVVAHEVLNSASIAWRRGTEVASCEGMYRPGDGLIVVSDQGPQDLHVVHELIHVGQDFPPDWQHMPHANARLGLAEGLAVSIGADITRRPQNVSGSYVALAWMTTALLPGARDRALFNRLGIRDALSGLARAYRVSDAKLAGAIDAVWKIADGDPNRVARVLAEAEIEGAAARVGAMQ